MKQYLLDPFMSGQANRAALDAILSATARAILSAHWPNARVVVRECSPHVTRDGVIHLPPVDLSDPVALALLRGWLDHECGHLHADSDFGAFRRFSAKHPPLGNAAWNAAEDVRIEAVMERDYPGCAVNLPSARDALSRDPKMLDRTRSVEASMVWLVYMGAAGPAQLHPSVVAALDPARLSRWRADLRHPNATCATTDRVALEVLAALGLPSAVAEAAQSAAKGGASGAAKGGAPADGADGGGAKGGKRRRRAAPPPTPGPSSDRLDGAPAAANLSGADDRHAISLPAQALDSLSQSQGGRGASGGGGAYECKQADPQGRHTPADERRTANGVGATLARLLTTERHRWTLRRQTSGRLDPRTLPEAAARPAGGVFLRRQESPAVRAAVIVALDLSGSMSPILPTALATAYGVVRAVRDCGGAALLTGWASSTYCVLSPWDDPTPTPRYPYRGFSGGTVPGPHLLQLAASMRRRPERLRYCLVLTDGIYNGDPRPGIVALSRVCRLAVVAASASLHAIEPTEQAVSAMAQWQQAGASAEAVRGWESAIIVPAMLKALRGARVRA